MPQPIPDSAANGQVVTPAPQGDTPTPTTPERTISQEEFDRHSAAQRRKYETEMSDLRSQLAQAQTPTKPSPTKPPQTKPKSDTTDRWEPSRTDYRVFDRTAASLKLNDAQYAILEREWQDKSVTEEIGSFVATFAESMGWVKQEPKPETDVNAQDDSKDKPAPVTGTGAAAAISTDYQQKSARDWGQEDIDRIYAEKGLHKGRKFIREQFELALKGVRVVPQR